MSASMVRRGLELLSDDIKDVASDHKKTKKNKEMDAEIQGKGTMDQIRSNKQEVKKQIHRLRGRSTMAKNQATVKDKRIKSAVEEFLKTQKSHLSDNLHYFRGENVKAKQSDTAKILLQVKGRKSQDRPDRPAKKPKEQRSVFTEEEFQQFQLEYFGTTVEGDYL